MNLAEFIAMGGYAPYVWSAYGIAAVVLVVNVLAPLHRRRQLLEELRRRARARRRYDDTQG